MARWDGCVQSTTRSGGQVCHHPYNARKAGRTRRATAAERRGGHEQLGSNSPAEVARNNDGV